MVKLIREFCFYVIEVKGSMSVFSLIELCMEIIEVFVRLGVGYFVIWVNCFKGLL